MEDLKPQQKKIIIMELMNLELIVKYIIKTKNKFYTQKNKLEKQ